MYRRDRTEGQRVSLYLGVEKAGIVAQLQEWFGDLGVPVLALGGYSSESYEATVIEDVGAAQRPAVLLYAGDHDPSGEDIDRNFVEKTDCWDAVRRVALTAAQVEQYRLPPQPGKDTDSRAPRFVERHGRLVQVELDACRPTFCASCSPARSPNFGTIPPIARRSRVRMRTVESSNDDRHLAADDERAVPRDPENRRTTHARLSLFGLVRVGHPAGGDADG